MIKIWWIMIVYHVKHLPLRAVYSTFGKTKTNSIKFKQLSNTL